MATAAVWISPHRIGGKPCIYGHRISTRQVASLVWDGGLEAMHRGWPHLTDDEILVACWYEVVHGNRRSWLKSYPDWPKSYDEAEWRAR